MSTLMYAQMGQSIISGLGNFASANIQANLDKHMQAYRNTMSDLSAARSYNAVTTNEVRARDTQMQTLELIQRKSIEDQGRQEVEAAAAGVTGASVELAARDLNASAGRATYAQQRQYQQTRSDAGEQRKSIALGAIYNEDIQVIPKPSAAMALMGIGTNLLSVYDSHQPEGSRLLGPNGGRVGDTQLL